MSVDAVIVGSGPNGLSAAITLARAGRSVHVLEAAETIGGGMRSAELTLPGFVHDVCSAIHPMGVASPFFRNVPLDEFGLEWIHPEAPFAHPLADGTTAVVERSLEETAAGFGDDGRAYRRMVQPFVKRSEQLFAQVLGPMTRLPRHPFLMARFGLRGIRSARRLAQRWFTQDHVQGMFAGAAAHSILPLEQWLTGAVGLMFCITAHSGGWPMARGGSQRIADAMADYLRSMSGTIETGSPVRTMSDIPPAKAVLFDTTPRQLMEITGELLPSRYRRTMQRFRYGPAVYKIDWALDGPIPWKSEGCRRAGTVHVGGTFDDVAVAEKAAWTNTTAEHPFVLLAQQSLFDASRAPQGKHTAWGYCHVPNGTTTDMTQRIESQLERFAPGFRDLILKRHVMTPADFQGYNANYIGGDITGGVMDFRQMLARPALRLVPYATPRKNVFLCSSSTPPGPGVHGMCGYHAARAALKSVLRD